MSDNLELWKKIDLFEHILISSNGRIMNELSGFIYKPTLNKQGYYVWTGPDRKQYKIHRLVGYAFQEICGKYQEGLQIDHINTIKTDNRATNLRWVTIKENQNNPLTRKKKSICKIGDLNPMKMKDVSMKSALWKVGRHLSDEHKKKISEANKGKFVSDETRHLLSINSYKRKRNNKGRFDYEDI